MRTLDEVRAKYEALRKENAMLDFRPEVLGVHLPEGWKEGHEEEHKKFPLTEEFVTKELLEYLQFAFDKAINHRGISASRSVQKLSMWAWILGLDELVKFAEDDANYRNYGVPILKKFAEHFKVELPERLKLWENGKPCEPECDMGCG